MKQIKEFTGLLCGLYLIAISVLLPLYTGGSYWKLGDTKYLFFRDVSLLCLGIWLVVMLFAKLRERIPRSGRNAAEKSGEMGGIIAETEGTAGETEGTAGETEGTAGETEGTAGETEGTAGETEGTAGKTEGTAGEIGETDGSAAGTSSALDTFMLLYAFCVLLSTLLSSYRGTAWIGFNEWYMGAVSQLLFVGIYFFVSRNYDGKKYVPFLWSAAFGIVVFIGLANRLGLDPTGLFSGFNSGDWEYSHMLSTIGNINWFCGYCGVALAVPLAGYFLSGKRWEAVLFYMLSAAGLLLLLIQGSDIGMLMTAVCLAVCLLSGVGKYIPIKRVLLLTGGVCLLLPVYGLTAALLGEEARKALPADGIGWDKICWGGWWVAAAVCFAAGRRCKARKRYIGTDGAAPPEKHKSAGRRYLFPCIALALLGIAFFVFLYCLLRWEWQRPDGMWGSGRGTLWRLALQGFLQNDMVHKLIGVGPDCFAEYLYSSFSPDQLLSLEGRWENAVYANAHNEWLNHLVNLGIMGTGCYLGIFVAGIAGGLGLLGRQSREARGIGFAGVVALVLYAAASLTCFQQCISTPLLFAMLGLCEREKRQFRRDGY